MYQYFCTLQTGWSQSLIFTPACLHLALQFFEKILQKKPFQVALDGFSMVAILYPRLQLVHLCCDNEFEPAVSLLTPRQQKSILHIKYNR